MPLLNTFSRYLGKIIFSHCQHRTTVTTSTPITVKALKKSLKSHSCGKLRAIDVGTKVRIRGFLQYHRMGSFAILRDTYGKVQIMIENKDENFMKFLKDLPFESYIEVIGTVRQRPENAINKAMATGDIEVIAETFEVVNRVTNDLPFLIRDHNCPNETIALSYQYLNLRHSHIQNILRFRSKVSKKIRDYLQDIEDFTEITTPTLSFSTPGGAQEFVVPTRTKENYYTLVQSPQIYKQLAMVGGLEKYFQFAPCYRDEGRRPDRQPEFIQLDLEMSDTTREEVMQLMENIIIKSWIDLPVDSLKFPILTYKEAMEQYGTDKPDTTFDWKLSDISEFFLKEESTAAELLQVEGSEAIGFLIPNAKKFITNKYRKLWAEKALNLSFVTSFIYFKEDGTIKSDNNKTYGDGTRKDITKYFNAKSGDLIVIAIGPKFIVQKFLGSLRVEAASILEENNVVVRNKECFNFLWIIDFPLFEVDEETGAMVSCHHPFTSPHPEDAHLLYEDPLKVRSLHYDLVLNGNEIAGGSIRIHDATLQSYILNNILKISVKSFKCLLYALSFGAPPHGGIALGFDRYISILKRTNSIRDVMAFPKSAEGKCFMSGAPSDIQYSDKTLYHLH